MRPRATNTVVKLGGSYFFDNSRAAPVPDGIAKPHTPKVIKINFSKPKTVEVSPTEEINDGRKRRQPGYHSWSAMKQRIDNPKHPHFADYGGRGISYDHNWQSFDRFISEMGPPPADGYSLERLDVDGDYCKDNCEWATAKQQARNRRNNRIIEHNGRELPLSQLAEENDISPSTLSARLKRGMSPEQAIRAPVKHGGAPHVQVIAILSALNRWPSTLTEQMQQSLEERYVNRAMLEQTRPDFFIALFGDQYCEAASTLLADPEEVPQAIREKAMRLVDVHQEAQLMSAQLAKEAIVVSRKQCPCCGQSIRRN